MVLDRKFSALKANSSKEQSAKGHRKMTGKPTKRSAGRILSTDRSDVGNGIEYIAEEAVWRGDPQVGSFQYQRSLSGVEMILYLDPSNALPVVESKKSTTGRHASSSLDAYEEGIWHEKMNKNGIYRPHGNVMNGEDGVSWWQEDTNGHWLRAVYHDTIRAQLIEDCAQNGTYKYARAGGKQGLDITSFLPEQESWGFQRHQRPDILHQFEKADHVNPEYPVHIWVYHGAIVLGHDDCPILNFANMPATISSMVEGGLQEAIIREDSRIDAKDFHVRMPTDPKGKGKMSLPGLSAISMRRSRFRWRAGYLSWTPRTGSDDIKNYLCELLPEHCKAENSTKGFRELKSSEVKLMALMNRGKHLKRAGPRALTEAKRKHSDALFLKSITSAMQLEELSKQNCNNSEAEDADFDMGDDPNMDYDLVEEFHHDGDDLENSLENSLSCYFRSLPQMGLESWTGI